MNLPKPGVRYTVPFGNSSKVCYAIDGHLIGQLGYEEGFVNLIEDKTFTYSGCCGTSWFEENAIPVRAKTEKHRSRFLTDLRSK